MHPHSRNLGQGAAVLSVVLHLESECGLPEAPPRGLPLLDNAPHEGRAEPRHDSVPWGPGRFKPPFFAKENRILYPSPKENRPATGAELRKSGLKEAKAAVHKQLGSNPAGNAANLRAAFQPGHRERVGADGQAGNNVKAHPGHLGPCQTLGKNPGDPVQRGVAPSCLGASEPCEGSDPEGTCPAGASSDQTGRVPLRGPASSSTLQSRPRVIVTDTCIGRQPPDVTLQGSEALRSEPPWDSCDRDLTASSVSMDTSLAVCSSRPGQLGAFFCLLRVALAQLRVPRALNFGLRGGLCPGMLCTCLTCPSMLYTCLTLSAISGMGSLNSSLGRFVFLMARFFETIPL